MMPFGIPTYGFNQLLGKAIRLARRVFKNPYAQAWQMWQQQQQQPQVMPLSAAPQATQPQQPTVQRSTAQQPVAQLPEQPQPKTWQEYVGDIYEWLKPRELPAVPELPMPMEPMTTDWRRLLPIALGLMFAPEAVRRGALAGAGQAFLQQEQAKHDYLQALAQRAYQQADLERQRQIAQLQADAQAREEAAKMAQQQRLAELQAQTQLDRTRLLADMQAVSRHMAIANNPMLPAEQRAAAYQNAAAILSQYGYELPVLPSTPSVAERKQTLAETIEPQKLDIQRQNVQLKREAFDWKKWKDQNQVAQGWKRLENQEKMLGIAAANMQLAMKRLDFNMLQQSQRNIMGAYVQLGLQERALESQLNAVNQNGRSIFEIAPDRAKQLLSGAKPQNATEARFQDLGWRLYRVRKMKAWAEKLMLGNLPLPPEGVLDLQDIGALDSVGGGPYSGVSSDGIQFWFGNPF